MGSLVDKIQATAIEKGVEIKVCSEYHIQLKGVYIVNVYETKSTFYINGMEKAQRFNPGQPEKLVLVASGESDFKFTGQKADRKKFKRTAKLQRWRENPICYYCKELIKDPSEATWEHKISLDKGGSNRRDNMALSHERCNRERGNSIKTKEKRS